MAEKVHALNPGNDEGGGKSKDEPVFKPAVIKSAVKNLETLCKRYMDAADAFNAASAEVAEKGGIKAKHLRRWIRAKCKECVEETKSEQAQMQLLIEEVG